MNPPYNTLPSAAPIKTDGKAIWSLVLGILGLCFILPALPALILGILSLIKIGKSPVPINGKGLAIGGIVTSGLSILMIPVIAGMSVPIYTRVLENARINQAKVVGLQLFADSQAFTLDKGKWPASLEELPSYKPGNTPNEGVNPTHFRLLVPGAAPDQVTAETPVLQLDHPKVTSKTLTVFGDGQIKMELKDNP